MNQKKYMMLCMVVGMIFSSYPLKAQTDTTVSLSLTQAREFALQHNKDIQNAQRSISSADYSVKQTISQYMPQVSIAANFTDYTDLATNILPGEMFGTEGDVAVQFGQQFNADYSGTASQMIFNGSLLVGIESAKIAKELSEQDLLMKERDVLKNIQDTYYLVLTCHESIDILKENLKNISKLYDQTQVSNKAGLIEDTQVDQLMVQKTDVKDALLSLERQLELSYNLLRYQLGLDAGAEITLTDSLSGLIMDFQVNTLLNEKFSLSNNIDFNLMETQLKLSETAVKSEKAAWLPTVSAYYSYSRTGMGNEVSSMDWYPVSILGVQASFPIFSSGGRHHAISKAKVEYEIAKTNKDLVGDYLNIQEKQVRFNMRNAYEKYLNQVQNKEVAKRVFNHTSLKYLQGIASGTELIQANDDYLSSASSYISAMSELLDAKTEFNSLFYNLK